MLAAARPAAAPDRQAGLAVSDPAGPAAALAGRPRRSSGPSRGKPRPPPAAAAPGRGEDAAAPLRRASGMARPPGLASPGRPAGLRTPPGLRRDRAGPLAGRGRALDAPAPHRRQGLEPPPGRGPASEAEAFPRQAIPERLRRRLVDPAKRRGPVRGSGNPLQGGLQASACPDHGVSGPSAEKISPNQSLAGLGANVKGKIGENGAKRPRGGQKKAPGPGGRFQPARRRRVRRRWLIPGSFPIMPHDAAMIRVDIARGSHPLDPDRAQVLVP
jgi:hypothetical protein